MIGKGNDIIQTKNQRINTDITADPVRLTGPAGDARGIVSLATALQEAELAGLDLVEIAVNADPPVCRIMDYSKFRFQEQKHAQEIKKKQKRTQVKEIKFRPHTDDGDYAVKVRNLTKFLDAGDKVRVSLRFKGREMAHQEFGQRLLERVRHDIDVHGVVEQFPKMEGRELVMMVAPRKARKEEELKSDKVESRAGGQTSAKPVPRTEKPPTEQAHKEPTPKSGGTPEATTGDGG